MPKSSKVYMNKLENKLHSMLSSYRLKDSLGLKRASPSGVSNNSLEFDLGAQSTLGKLFNVVLVLGYIAVASLAAGSVFGWLRSIDSDFPISGGTVWIMLFLFLFLFLFIFLNYFKNTISLSISASYEFLLILLPFVTLFLCSTLSFFYEFIFVYIGFDFLYLILIIIIAHVGRHIVIVRNGDRLIVRFSPGRYEIFYQHSKVNTGIFSQTCIEIRSIKGGAYYQAVFFPSDKMHPKFKRIVLFTNNTDMANHKDNCTEVTSDLESIFMYLHIPYYSCSWKVVNGNPSNI